MLQMYIFSSLFASFFRKKDGCTVEPPFVFSRSSLLLPTDGQGKGEVASI
jgi:hypothetical protein